MAAKDIPKRVRNERVKLARLIARPRRVKRLRARLADRVYLKLPWSHVPGVP